MRDHTRQAQQTVHAEGSDRQVQQAHSREGTYRDGGAHRRTVHGPRHPRIGPLREPESNPLTERARTSSKSHGGLGAHRGRSRGIQRTGSIPLTSTRSLMRWPSRLSRGIHGRLWPYTDVDDVPIGALWPHTRGCDAVSESQDVKGVDLAEGSDGNVLDFRGGHRSSTGRVFDLPRRRPRVLIRRNNGSLSEMGPYARIGPNKGGYLHKQSLSAGPSTGPQQAHNRRLSP